MFPQETVPHMFSNIKSIYKFHHDFLLPQLEERMKSWDIDPRIGKEWKCSSLLYHWTEGNSPFFLCQSFMAFFFFTGDIMKNFAPFLKLYTEYVKNFDSAMSLINVMQLKNSRFAAIMHEIHVSF